MRPLGRVQRDVLEALKEHGEWSPNGVAGWVWDNESGTRRVLDSLVRRGLVRVDLVEIRRSMRHIGGSQRYVEERTVYRPVRGKGALRSI